MVSPGCRADRAPKMAAWRNRLATPRASNGCTPSAITGIEELPAMMEVLENDEWKYLARRAGRWPCGEHCQSFRLLQANSRKRHEAVLPIGVTPQTERKSTRLNS